jgi:hypothetical protein
MDRNTSETEKNMGVDHVDKLETSDSGIDNFEDDPRVPVIRWKVDIRLSFMLALMHIVNQVDEPIFPMRKFASLNLYAPILTG